MKMKYTNLDGSPIGCMKSLEFLSTAFAVAGLVWVFLLYHPAAQPVVEVVERVCPDIVVERKHGVGSDLKTYAVVRAVDACANNLNIK
jgi:hypothetical protein